METFMNTTRNRPVKTDHYIWCDYHGEIHRSETNYYGDAYPSVDETIISPCSRENWRTVYVLGQPDEDF